MDVHIHMNFHGGYPEGCDLNLQIAGKKKAKFFPLSTQNSSQNGVPVLDTTCKENRLRKGGKEVQGEEARDGKWLEGLCVCVSLHNPCKQERLCLDSQQWEEGTVNVFGRHHRAEGSRPRQIRGLFPVRGMRRGLCAFLLFLSLAT